MTRDAINTWRKATYSHGNGACVEVAAGRTFATWRKASYSVGNGNCVEVAGERRVIGVRDTVQGDCGPVLEFPVAAWRAFIGHAKS
jgi:hypothetical protein